ncbi:MAG TPA: DEAD/DEAH box helicase [Pyrinomonadaceae bacterium]|nr:DEAD/DEAH box helicase [Pyrinomonadaceae bacterium]
MTEIKLRDYQREAIDAVFKAWAGGMQRPAIVLPTGAGKTVVFASLIKEWRHEATYADFPHGTRVIVLAHRDELVDQALAKLRSVLPQSVSVGKVKAQDQEITADVMVCSVQTLASARRRDQVADAQHVGRVGLIITDECHHAAAASYRKIYDAFPDALNLGVTATMARGDGVGLGKVWDDVVYQRSILNLISKGHLTDVRTRKVVVGNLGLNEVGMSRGDYRVDDLGKALMESGTFAAIPRAYKEHAGDRRGIVFTPTVETAVAAQSALETSGISSAVVSGQTPRDVRHKMYEQFRTGGVQVLVNCMVLTEGFDAPWAEVAVIARPTQSAPLYTQMVGRVLRPWPGKKEALVLDLVDASACKLRTLIDLEPGEIEAVEDGESLAEAVVREAEEGNQKAPAGSLAFELKVRDISSFEASEYAWNRTQGGVLFISCGEARVFLWPTPDQVGLWDVCVSPNPGRKWERTRYTGLPVGEAMAWGEAVSEDYADFSVARSARWRKAKPSEAQLAYAEGLGIEASGMNRGELSLAIDVVKSSRLFDRFIVKG